MEHVITPHIVAIANNKGGVGKTTTTVYIGCSLARMGFSVLLIDFDPQGDLETALGVDVSENGLTTENAIKGANSRWLSNYVGAKVSITPATPELQNIEAELQKTYSPDVVQRIQDKIPVGIGGGIQFVIIDCPPTLNNLTRAAISVSEDVIIPVNPVPADMKALGRTIEYVKLVDDRKVKKIHILFTRDQHYNINEDAKLIINESYPRLAFKQSISATVQMEETSLRGAIRHPLKRNSGAADYVEVVNELLIRLGVNPREVAYEK